MTDMTSREIVKRCIEFKEPPRIGLHFHVSPIDGKRWPLSDFGSVSYGSDPDWTPPDEHTNEWGAKHETFDDTRENMGQVKDNPLGAGWGALDTYRFPDFTKEARYSDLPERVAALHSEGRYVYGSITYDDMGTNDRALVSPELFRSIYFPRYRAGCDVLQLDQPRLMGIEWLAERYSGRLCFWNPIDIQTTIHAGGAAIEDEAHHQVWAFGRHGGGFMVKAYQQPNAVGMTVDASEAQYRAFLEYADYPLVPYS